MRYAIALTSEKGQPVETPHFVAKGARLSHDFGSYVGPFWMVTTEQEQAHTVARRETAERWAATLTGGHADIRTFEVVEVSA